MDAVKLDLTGRLARAAATRPRRMLAIWGIAILTGIGFTMSLFIADLAFPALHRFVEARLGVLIGSLASFVIGILVLAAMFPRRAA